MIELFITSSVLILLICFVRKVLKGRLHPTVQYALWLLVVFKLFPLSLIPGVSITPVKSTVSVMNLVPAEHSFLDQGSQEEENSVLNFFQKENQIEIMAPSDKDSLNQASAMPVDRIRHLFYMIWMAGIIIGVIVFLFTNMRLRQFLLKNRVPFEVPNSFVPCYIVKDLKTPCIFRIQWKNAIYLTKEVAENEEQRRCICSMSIVIIVIWIISGRGSVARC